MRSSISEKLLLCHPAMREYHSRRAKVYQKFGISFDLFFPTDLFNYDGDIYSYNYSGPLVYCGPPPLLIDKGCSNYNFKNYMSNTINKNNIDIIFFQDDNNFISIDLLDYTNDNYIVLFSQKSIYIIVFSIKRINGLLDYNKDHYTLFSSSIMSKTPFDRNIL